MQFSEFRASIRRRWPVAVVVLLLIPMVMVAYLASREVVRLPDRYTTSGDILIPARDPASGVTPEKVPPVLLQGQVELALSQTTKDVALRALKMDPEVDHDIGFDAKLSENGTIMTLTVAAPRPELASAVLGAYIAAFADGRRQSVLESAVDIQEVELRVIEVLGQKLAQIEAELDARGVPLLPQVIDGTTLVLPPGTSIDAVLLAYERNAVLNELDRRQLSYGLQSTRAAIPGSYTTEVQRRSTARVTPPPPSPVKPLLEIVIGGVLLALALPVLLDRLDPTITEARSAPGALRARMLGTIPFMPRRLQQRLAPEESGWELAFRSLAATSIATDQLPKALMVTSPMGTTQDAVAANFGAALAHLGMTVALVGTTPRQGWFLDDCARHDTEDAEDETEREQREEKLDQELEKLLASTMASPPPPRGGTRLETALRPAPTLPELLADAHAGRLSDDLRARLARRDIPNLYVIPPGEAGAELTLDGLPPLLEALATNGVDVTLIAGPALLEDPNATIMAWSTRHVLWAVEMGQVKKGDAHLAADRLELAGVAPFGIAVVNRNAFRA